MKRILLLVALIAQTTLAFSQSITIIDARDSMPIDGILILDTEGNYLGMTSTDGVVPFDIMSHKQQVIFSHLSFGEDTFKAARVANQHYAIEQNHSYSLPDVVVTGKNDYLSLKGYFYSIVSNNGLFNIFVDGIIEYVFDKKTLKYKHKNIIEYRTFSMNDDSTQVKNVPSYVFDALVEIPELKNVSKITKTNSKFQKKSGNTSDKSMYEYEIDKETKDKFSIKILGYHISGMYRKETFLVDGDSFRVSKLNEYSILTTVNIKHKSEENFSKIAMVSKFYPTSLQYIDKGEQAKGVRFSREKSSYISTFWKDDANASFYQLLSNIFHNRLIERANEQAKKGK